MSREKIVFMNSPICSYNHLLTIILRYVKIRQDLLRLSRAMFGKVRNNAYLARQIWPWCGLVLLGLVRCSWVGVWHGREIMFMSRPGQVRCGKVGFGNSCLGDASCGMVM